MAMQMMCRGRIFLISSWATLFFAGLVWAGTTLPKEQPSKGHYVAMLIWPQTNFHWIRMDDVRACTECALPRVHFMLSLYIYIYVCVCVRVFVICPFRFKYFRSHGRICSGPTSREARPFAILTMMEIRSPILPRLTLPPGPNFAGTLVQSAGCWCYRRDVLLAAICCFF